jgi:hypothetical protein
MSFPPDNKEKQMLSDETKRNLMVELHLAEETKGRPGADADRTDTPRR